MKHNSVKYFMLLLLSSLFLLNSCNSANNKTEKETTSSSELWSVQMGETVVNLHSDIWSVDPGKDPRWQYKIGLVGDAMIDLYDATGDKRFYDFAKKYVDFCIDDQGQINYGYKLSDFNIDNINSGKLLFRFFEDTKDERYKTALDTLRKQLEFHPRTMEGGFWHKKRYISQIWLDGLYMGQPFFAEYSVKFNEPENFDDIVHQILLIEEKARDPETGLLYHGWDEKRQQNWANKETGLSKNFWGRGVGWYAMALVDVLDFLPADHSGHKDVVGVLERLVEAILKVQDEETGLWYQVMNMGDREGNYLESTASTMFIYSMYKGVRMGYLDKKYLTPATKAYLGLIENLVIKDKDGNVIVTQACGGAGLSAERDGTYEYYINEIIKDNDPKVIGPFILASLEYERLSKK